MDTSLWEHQLEIAAVARHRSVLVSSPQAVGKTFLSCALLCEAAVSSGQQFVLAVGASPSDRLEIQRQLARVCSLQVVISDDSSSEISSDSVDPSKKNHKAASRWLEDVEWTRQKLQAARGQIALLSPLILQESLRKGILQLSEVALLVVEAWDQVHAELPSFFKLVTRLTEELPSDKMLKIFATSRLPASKMDWNPVNNPLLKHIQVLNMVPVLPPLSMEPSFPPLMCETFEVKKAQDKNQVSVRDFLLGENSKKVDLVRVFRLELELGNSAAVYDERKKQDKVNRFIQDAEAVEQHLGC
ncbi:hypothetical protein BBO99_00006356 [Phytophthora kernoviae]|uniref:Helicase ATP-binding domain-containing protein n=2 Tax=Phytophthora kernoviae TaxID=325452 RepID=A0A3R7NE60_9STRA|nr:hypothetical protein G195_009500 [Phytophthora kernoviae 00238/432]KAG2521937.1 hypothetical protein JM16_006073 [Phytophthora kernoviae]KAG2523396.1 hypothetical protein JM18_005791 [Phytophthora kernoviae]RLN10526.1 hypothetical protein BBI17_006473 [Phytophthora kernoviae]RLN77930.1 hypothetical protein BBO99_00006356 [Phytophthora kernoviae]